MNNDYNYIKEICASAIEEVTSVYPFDVTDSLESFLFGEMELIETILVIERELNISLPDGEIGFDTLKTVEDLINWVIEYYK